MKIIRKTGDAGIELIKSFESCRTAAYQDSARIWTIGWGHTGPDVHEGLVVTQAQCDELLRHDLAEAEEIVNRLVVVPINQWQFDALVSFSYNVGEGSPKRMGFKQSTLLRCLNKKNYADAAQEFLKWVKAGGVRMPGLLRRREAERSLFLRNEAPNG